MDARRLEYFRRTEQVTKAALAKLESLLIKDVSGVDAPAHEIDGWAVLKAAQPKTEQPDFGAEQEDELLSKPPLQLKPPKGKKPRKRPEPEDEDGAATSGRPGEALDQIPNAGLSDSMHKGRKFLAARYQKATGSVKMLYAEGGEPLEDVLEGMLGIGIDPDSLAALCGAPAKNSLALAKARHQARHAETGQFVVDGHPRQRARAGLFTDATKTAYGLFGPSRAAAEARAASAGE
jgi:hypothetical protein